MRLRAAVAADVDAIADVFLHCWLDAYPGVLADEVLAGMDETAARELWRAALGSEGGQTEVAEEAGSVVGVVRFGFDPADRRRGHIFSLYVHPGASRSGIGGALMARAAHWFRSQHLREATLWVFEANSGARGFYARHGWSPDGEVRTEPQFQALEVRLSLRLDPD
jgi:GNAT superfamily N-acetyltransferase